MPILSDIALAAAEALATADFQVEPTATKREKILTNMAARAANPIPLPARL